MTIVDKKFDTPIDCSCGAEIDHYSIGYGRTPYMITCPQCKCTLDKVMPFGMGGLIETSVEAWNDYHRAVAYLKEVKNIYSPTPDQIRERLYRVLKGWENG